MAEGITRVSVRNMVEFSLRGEDLQASSDVRSMVEGTRAHQARQAEAARETPGYESEVSLSLDGVYDGFPLRVQGRADGLFMRQGVLVVEEIKHSFDVRTQAEQAHTAQCACYAHMLCTTRALECAVVRVLYVSRAGEEVCAFEERCDARTLREIFEGYAAAYARFAAREAQHIMRRDASLAALSFPYGAYRAGQRAMCANVYIAIRDRRRLIAQAPTGTGKTAAALFPALKALGEGKTSRIVYLTARTTGRALALHTLEAMNMPLRALEVTAKDKICPYDERRCAPEDCPRARGFFLRLDGALEEALACSHPLSRADIEAIAQRHSVCPFEFSLIFAQMADVVVCDYNYVFDPFVQLDFLSAASSRMTLLIDEAHNLPERVRDMLSAHLDAKEITRWRRAWGKRYGRRDTLYGVLTELLRALEKDAGSPDVALLGEASQRLCDACGMALAQGRSAAAEIFLCARAFSFTAAHFDKRFALLCEGEARTRRVQLLCLDGAPHIAQTTRRMRGTVFFSATLSPVAAFRTLLGIQEEDAALSLPSPFPQENLLIMRLAIDTRYGARERSAPQVAQALREMCEAHAGHYLFIFPSYAYLALVRERFADMLPQAVILCERAGMDETEREQMLSRFEQLPVPGEILAGFGVMGGGFSEAVDLPGERLCGVAVVGVGLPMLCAQRDALRDYYDANGEDGFHLAYRVPGMIRVLQSAGRVIRTPQDRGAVLLIDTRFFTAAYAAMMPPHFSHLLSGGAEGDVRRALRAFYAADAGV